MVNTTSLWEGSRSGGLVQLRLQSQRRNEISFLNFHPDVARQPLLLDWSTNPLVALWFAVAKEPKEGKDGTIWVFETDESQYVDQTEEGSSPFDGNGTEVFRPGHLNGRIVSQQGWSTCHKIIDGNRFGSLEKNPKYKKSISKLSIDPSFFHRIRRELDRFGINYATMFPDLEGLCKKIGLFAKSCGK